MMQQSGHTCEESKHLIEKPWGPNSFTISVAKSPPAQLAESGTRSTAIQARKKFATGTIGRREGARLFCSFSRLPEIFGSSQREVLTDIFVAR
jgi:hypothetical protein